MQWGRQNLAVKSQVVIIVEWRIAMNHLVDKDTKRPPVYALVVSSRLEDLRSKILWCSTQSPAPVTDHLGEAEVSDNNMTQAVKKNVLRLEVPFKNIWS